MSIFFRILIIAFAQRLYFINVILYKLGVLSLAGPVDLSLIEIPHLLLQFKVKSENLVLTCLNLT